MITSQPEFVRIPYFSSGDSIQFIECFDSDSKKVFLCCDDFQNLNTIDSCNIYMVYNIVSSYNRYTVLNEHNKKLIAIYKRESPQSWLRIKDHDRTVLLEDRKQIVATDTASQIDPLTFDEDKIITHYYKVAQK